MNKLKVFLVNWDVLKIVSPFKIESNDYEIYDTSCNKVTTGYFKDFHPINSDTFIYYVSLDKKLELGEIFYLKIGTLMFSVIDVSPCSLLDDFDDKYGYDGNDLGSSLKDNKIHFALWAPHATFAELEYFINGRRYITNMKRTDKGVYRVSIKKTDLPIFYRYIININNDIFPVIDPYAKFATPNLEFAVASFKDFNIDLHINCLKDLKPSEHIIYETNVRDFTINKNSNIANKGKFLGLVEENRTTTGGHPAGLDYLKFLGITTLQLQPIFEIATINDNNPSEKYNWGYDPAHYFVLEGSYSSNVNDPLQAKYDFMSLVSKLHKENIRVSIDVVYNHMYDPISSTLEKIVPFYFFRRKNDIVWTLQNQSGCGGDFASDRFMARKLIIDSATYLIKELGVDALRFDLMGLIDIKTIQILFEKCRNFRKDIIFYGEGWSMGGETHDHSELLTMDYGNVMPYIGFFNDRYRNICKGSGEKARQNENGFLLGNMNMIHGFKFVFSGASFPFTYSPLFNNISQSINYIECHDNCALFDTVSSSLKLEDENMIMKRIDFINRVLLLSFGIPFIHAGQEIGFSKLCHHNTYNEGDRFNNFDYSLLDKRFEYALKLKENIELRKKLQIFSDVNLPLNDIVSYVNLDYGILIQIKGKFNILINVSDDNQYFNDKLVYPMSVEVFE